MDEPYSIFTPPLRPLTIALLTITSLSAFDALSVYAALPAIGADLGHLSLMSWVITGYLLASAVAIIVSGPLIDAWGARRAFRFAVLLFFVATTACAVSPTLPILIAARILQGWGGGISVAVALVTVGLTHPESLRSRAFAAQSFVWSVVGLSGPPVVAGMVATIGWRGVFAVNLPLTALALSFGWRRVPAARESRAVKFDRSGTALVVVFTAALLVGLAHLGWTTAVWLFVGAAALVIYARRRVASKMVEARHLLGWPRGALGLTVFLVLAGSLGIESFLPVYIRGALGRSQATAATGVVYLTIGWTLGSFAGSRLERKWPAARQIQIATAVLPISISLATLVVAETQSVLLIGVTYFAMGLSVGAVSTLGLTVLQAGTAENELGRVNAAHQYVRTVAISAGIALATGIVLAVVAARIGDVESVRSLLSGDSDAAVGERAKAAIKTGYVWAHLAGVLITALAIVPARSLTAPRDDSSGRRTG